MIILTSMSGFGSGEAPSGGGGATSGYRGLYLEISHDGTSNTGIAEVVFHERGVGDISGATGTAIGNMTGNGGLSAAFDGTVSQAFSSGSQRSANSGSTVGKDWGAGNDYDIDTIDITEPNNAKISSQTTTVNTTVVLKGTTDGTASGGTTIQTWNDIFNGVANGVYGTTKTLNVDTGAIT